MNMARLLACWLLLVVIYYLTHPLLQVRYANQELGRLENARLVPLVGVDPAWRSVYASVPEVEQNSPYELWLMHRFVLPHTQI